MQAGNSRDAGSFSPDAGALPDAGRQLQPDASTGGDTPDAAPAAVPEGTLLSIPRTEVLALDGELEAAWLASTFVDFAISDAPQLEAVGGYGSDASVRIASMYDASRIYFFLEVHDSLLVSNSENTYNDDSIELYIDGLNDRSGPYGDDDHWLVIGADAVYASLGPTALPIAGFIATTEVGYNIEISVERSELGANGNTVFGFNIGINDDDGLGSSDVDAYGLWHVPSSPVCNSCCAEAGDAYPWCDTTRLGQLELVP